MKYGQQLESESVPEWSLHNIDYNTLKEFIKVHTTRDQATAIAIPGHKDTALERFENDFYDELCRQHDRVGLFVATKADELNRRLQHVSDQVQRLLVRSARGTTTLKRQRRFAKYDRTTVQLGDEVRDLSRFVNAQVVAFRKILKKYRKWTGSSSLGTRFRENVLSDPKSFTRRDFTHLESQCDELLATVRAATPHSSSPQTPQNGTITPEEPDVGQHRRRSSARSQLYSSSSSTLHALSSSAGSILPQSRVSSGDSSRHVTITTTPPVQTHYWNEYDDGSEAGDGGGDNGGYAIYLQPEDDSEFPGMATVVSFFTVPYEKAKKWIAARKHHGEAFGENAPLLSQNGGYGTTGGVHLNGNVDMDHDGDAEDDDEDDGDRESGDEDDVFGSDSGFPQGYETHYAAFPSVSDQLLAHYRDIMLLRGILICYAAAIGLLGIAAILIATGRHKMRAEVDAGVTMGVVSSLGFACAALGMNMARQRRLSMVNQITVWTAFAAVCVLSGILLVFVMGNTVV